jgi:HEAT repeat protein
MAVAFVPRLLLAILLASSYGLTQEKQTRPDTPAAQQSPSGTQSQSSAQQEENKPAESKQQQQEKVPAQPRPLPENPETLAWDVLNKAMHSDKLSERVTSVQALSLMAENTTALKLAETALLDDKPEVRAAAAATLGELHYKSSIPKLRSILEDKDPTVVLAAAQALEKMHDESAYEVYYEILTGERKASKGLIASGIAETSILHDPKKLAKLGIEESISNVVPFGGYGVAAYRLMSRNEGARLRASAAKELADDPDPSSTKALVNAAGDNDWTVRASALEALSKRDDPSVLNTVELYLYDDKIEVKYNAAAATLHLLDIQHTRHPGGRDRREKKNSSDKSGQRQP